jgi:hypothetical protein
MGMTDFFKQLMAPFPYEVLLVLDHPTTEEAIRFCTEKFGADGLLDDGDDFVYDGKGIWTWYGVDYGDADVGFFFKHHQDAMLFKLNFG